uniref:RING-type E3 ubiquitin transferase n=1 Tax=Meleagris gallopavo TaxID=9103 RepID=A0A803YB37_MELGA
MASDVPNASAGERVAISRSPWPTATGGSMEAELDTRCPVCLDNWDSAAYAMPCCHQFCFPCIQRWTSTRPQCPLCKRDTENNNKKCVRGGCCFPILEA